MAIIDTLMTSLKDVEMEDNGQALDLFANPREVAVQDFVSSLLKPDVPLPKILFDNKFISKVREDTGRPNIQALYNSETKSIILDETSTLTDPKFKQEISHELLHYVDDFAAPDTIPGETAWRTGRPNEQINPSARRNITEYGLAEKSSLENYPDMISYMTPSWAYTTSDIVSNPQEHLTYYTAENLGIMPEMIAEDAALRALDEWKPLVEHVTESPGRWPWSKPRTSRSWSGGIEPRYDIRDISAYTQDRGAILDIFDELADKYFNEKGRSEFYQGQ